MFKSRSFQLLFSLALGASLTLSFAPFHIFLLGILIPAGLLSIWYFSTPRQAFLSGWLFGIGFFSTGVYWVYISIHTFGKAPAFLAFVITLIFIVILALFFGIQGVLTRFCFKDHRMIWGFPFIWVLFEVFRTYVLTGFPWLLLGYSQMDSTLSNIAPILSVYGVSFVTVVLSSLLAAIFLIRKKIILWIATLTGAFLWLSLWGMGKFSWGVQPTGQGLTVSLIQGNISQTLKWDIDQRNSILNTYRRLTALNWSSDLIIWPEAAVPMVQEESQYFLNQINQAANDKNTAIILGIPLLYGMNFYNGILVLGKGKGTYLKQHLVPFGEYIPFRFLLGFVLNHLEIPMSDMTAGNSNQALLNVKGIHLSASICYEIAYPDLVAKQVPAAEILVTLTDDSWFDPSIAKYQQLQMTQMRALETGRYLLAATNDGMTAIINSRGKIIKDLPPSQEGVVTARVPAMKGSTPWIRFLNILSLLSCRV